MLWQKNLPLHLDSAVLAVVQFGSTVIEGVTPNDVDIAILFKEVPLKQQLDIAQDIKQQLEKNVELPIHVKAFTYETLFDSSNFARIAIMSCGMDLLTKKPFAQRFGLKAQMQFAYSLQTLTKTEKVRIHYQLRGKKGDYGLLKKIGGVLVKPGLVRVPPNTEPIMSAFFTEEHITHEKKLIFELV